MGPHVHLLPADPRRPREAARATARSLLKRLPRQREVTVAVVGWARQPGLAVPWWTLEGVLEAVDELDLRAGEVTALGEPSASGRPKGRPPADRLGAGAGGDRFVRLSLPGLTRPARVPRSWIGTNLCLVSPLAHRRGDGRRLSLRREGDLDWVEPVQSALAALVSGLGADGPLRAQARAGARLAREVFASSTLILDATWWAAAQEHDRRSQAPSYQLASELVAPEHVLGTPSLGDPDAVLNLDAWLTGLLGLGRAIVGADAPRVVGRRHPWPSSRLPEPRASGRLADRAMDALWAGAAPRQGLGPTVPGRFSDAWIAGDRASGSR
jgi:hypothetical protein